MSTLRDYSVRMWCDKRRLPNKVRLITALIVVGILTATALRLNASRESILQIRAAAADSLARSVADGVAAKLLAGEILTVGMVERLESDGTRGVALQRLREMFTGRLRAIPSISAVAVYSATGEEIVSTVASAGLDRAALSLIVDHAAQDRWASVLGTPIQDVVSGQWSMTLSRRIDGPGPASGGIAVVTLSLSHLLDNLDLGSNGSVALVRGDGTVLLQVPNQPGRIGINIANGPFFRAYVANSGSQSTGAASEVDGRRRWESYAAVDGFPLIVFVGYTQSDALGRWISAAATWLTLSVCSAGLLGLLGWRLADELERTRLSQEATRASEEQFRLLADNCTDVIIRLNAEGRRIYVSPASTAMLGYTPAELLNGYPHEIMHTRDQEALSAWLANPSAEIGLTCRVRRKDGTYAWIEAMGRQVVDGGGRVVLVRDISRRKQVEDALHDANNALQRMALVDGLTGIANRRCFDMLLAKEFKRAERNGQSLSLLLFDVDHFKSYNDAFGHPAGDSCLKTIATAAAKHARRPTDVAARYGGEEFALLLPDTDVIGAGQIAEQLRESIEALGLRRAGAPGMVPGVVPGVVTVSVGVATTPPWQNGISQEELVRFADTCLYAAKRAGRNRICMHDGMRKPDAPSAELTPGRLVYAA